jgi:hypothetical protein
MDNATDDTPPSSPPPKRSRHGFIDSPLPQSSPPTPPACDAPSSETPSDARVIPVESAIPTTVSAEEMWHTMSFKMAHLIGIHPALIPAYSAPPHSVAEVLAQRILPVEMWSHVFQYIPAYSCCDNTEERLRKTLKELSKTRQGMDTLNYDGIKVDKRNQRDFPGSWISNSRNAFTIESSKIRLKHVCHAFCAALELRSSWSNLDTLVLMLNKEGSSIPIHIRQDVPDVVELPMQSFLGLRIFYRRHMSHLRSRIAAIERTKDVTLLNHLPELHKLLRRQKKASTRMSCLVAAVNRRNAKLTAQQPVATEYVFRRFMVTWHHSGSYTLRHCMESVDEYIKRTTADTLRSIEVENARRAQWDETTQRLRKRIIQTTLANDQINAYAGLEMFMFQAPVSPVYHPPLPRL